MHIYTYAKEGPYLGGMDLLVTFDTTTIELTKYNSTRDVYIYSEHVDSSTITVKFGVLKSNPEIGLCGEEAVNNAVYEDFDWYSTLAEAKEHGEPTAIYKNEPKNYGLNNWSYLYTNITTKEASEAIGYMGIGKVKVRVYLDEERTQIFTYGYETPVYEGAKFDEEENTITAGSPTGIGHSYYVSYYSLGLTSLFTQKFNNSEKTNYNVQEEKIDLKITPTLQMTVPAEDGYASTFRVEARIPSELYYKENSSNYEPSSVEMQSNGTTVVTWIFEDWLVNDPLPEITYSVTISPYATNNASKYFYHYFYDDGNKIMNSVSSGKSATITNLAGASLRKEMTRGFIDKEGDFEITDHIYNISQTQLKDIKTFEILPNNNDDKGSSFSGSYTYTLLSLASEQRFFYTTVEPNTIEYSIDDLGNKSIKDIDLGADSRFIEVFVGDTIPANATMTASYIPKINSMNDVEFSYSAHFTGNNGGDKYVYVLNASSTTLESAINTEPIEIIVAERKISGKAFEDVNRNDIYDEGDNLLPNINVELIKVTPGATEEDSDIETSIETKQTNEEGEYTFSLAIPGKYIVKFTNKDGYEIVTKGSANSPATSKVNADGKTDLINHEDNPYQAIMNKDNYNFGIRKKAATLTTKYLLYGADPEEALSESNVETVYYTDTYSTTALTPLPEKYVFHSISGDPTSGTVDKDNIEVIYYYVYRDATLTIKYVDQDGNDIDSTKNTINAPKHWDDTYSSEALTFTNYNYVNQTGDEPNGIIAKDSIEVIYHYQVKSADVTTKYVDQDGNNIISPETISSFWGNTYTTEQKVFTNYNFVEQTGDSTSGTIAKDHVEVIYHYQIKNATLTIKYVDQDGNDIDSTKNTINAPKHWGDEYSSSELEFTNYNFVEQTGDSPNGVIAKDHVEVIYVYTLKTSTVIVHHYINGTTNKLVADQIINKKYTQLYSTSPLDTTSLDYELVNQTGDEPNGIITKDSYEIIYNYKLKIGTVVTHHYLYNGEETTISLAPDVSNTYNYTENYETEISSEVPNNYELYKKSTNFTGIVRSSKIEVYYYYQLKDSQLSTTIEKTGTDKIIAKDEVLNYTINYNAELKDYIGDATITIKDVLPYKVDLEKSDLADGIYDEETDTITWEETWNDIDTYVEENQTAKKNIVKTITIVYTNVNSYERLMVNIAKSNTLLVNNERDVEAQKETVINIKGNIKVKYIDENEEIIDTKDYSSLVGESLITEAIEFEGYKLIERPTTEDYIFEDLDQTVIYKYERLKYKITTLVEGEGQGKITGDEIVPYGEDSTKDNIKIEAGKGYAIEKIIIDGEEIKIDKYLTSYVVNNFKEVKEDHVVIVRFITHNPNTSTKFIIITTIIGAITSFIALFNGRIFIKFNSKKRIS